MLRLHPPPRNDTCAHDYIQKKIHSPRPAIPRISPIENAFFNATVNGMIAQRPKGREIIEPTASAVGKVREERIEHRRCGTGMIAFQAHISRPLRTAYFVRGPRTS